MRRALLAIVLAVPVGCLAAADRPAAEESALSVRAGYDHTEGNYDQPSKTTLDSASVTLTYDVGDWSFDVVAPYLRESGPGRIVFLAGRRQFVTVGPDRVATGVGDVTAGVTRYVLNQEDEGIDLDLGAIVKFGTASRDKGLGTGKNDLALQAAVSREAGPFSATLTGGYTFVGKVTDLGLVNFAYGSLDASYKLGDPVRAGLTYSVGQTASTGTPGSRDLTAYVDMKLTKRCHVEVYVLHGYTTQSPGHGFGGTISFAL